MNDTDAIANKLPAYIKTSDGLRFYLTIYKNKNEWRGIYEDVTGKNYILETENDSLLELLEEMKIKVWDGEEQADFDFPVEFNEDLQSSDCIIKEDDNDNKN